MAIQTGQIRFTGRIGDLIGYYRNGVHCLRSRPAKVHQTKATRQAAQQFGIASRKGKLIRQAFAPHLNGRKDGGWVNRLNKTLIQSGLEGLKGYRFNQQTGIETFFPQFTIDHNNLLQIPAQVLPALPRKVTHLEVKLIAASINFNTGRVISTVSQSRFLDLKQSFEGLQFNAIAPKQGTLILALQVNAFQDNLPLLDKRYLATDLIAIQIPAKETISNTQRKKAKRFKSGKSWKSPGSQRWQIEKEILPIVLSHHLFNDRSGWNELRE
ncbi:hypothetical protein [Pseudobacter ginsenosidimutans]|uniref:Uncharacterized protein n=1 Tax=Pseudobacter ginsenosidimutans TaxID=661488 RepID=A0A4Q7MS90_9BACT|nr:hypothetical protein [Pseudobacter ginsenosidimutans]QEC41554.1 hypothetical protein FSB84_07520 [Pseudobacter ginsenosidimutans]RZS71662.1 hypothetical protein EV199_3570 [Pseudobacter ginsenosidimutans]